MTDRRTTCCLLDYTQRRSMIVPLSIKKHIYMITYIIFVYIFIITYGTSLTNRACCLNG